VSALAAEERRFAREHVLVAAALVSLALGAWLGLVVAPAPAGMGDLGRIWCLHRPTLWLGVITLALVPGCALAALHSRLPDPAEWLVALVEVCVLLVLLTLLQTSLWARPTWGTYWIWDPRVTATSVVLVGLLAVLGLRAVVAEPRRRARWTAVGAILATLAGSIVYIALAAGPRPMPELGRPLDWPSALTWAAYLNGLGLAALAAWLVVRRVRLARARR
jgi:heme exporter protein C